MSNDLYFIPIIADALQQPDQKAALQSAFSEIRRLGEVPEYHVGFAQFQRFMLAVVEARGEFEAVEQYARRLMVELASGVLGSDTEQGAAALALIRSRPEWQADYQALCAEQEQATWPGPLEFSVTWDEQPWETIRVDSVSGKGGLGGVLPGRYQLALGTGLVLWSAALTEGELVWAKAHPGQPLALAADTTGEGGRPTREDPLWGGEIVVRVFPGIESGRIEVEVRSAVGGG
jgi:hypothetical protein